MTYFLKNGNTFTVSDEASLDLHKKLPPGNYIVKQDMFKNFFLEQIDSFIAPDKIYGDTMKNSDRILRTFTDRSVSTGVMLTGEKGSGKSLLAKILAIEGAKQGIPCIVINFPWHGDAFNSLIQDIEQPCMILFDEFEKVYNKDQQESLLTLLDGVFPSKKLFVITCNDKWRVDQHIRNRPGRVFYMLDFTGLDVEFIREYCTDRLENKIHIDKIVQISGLYSDFNFDMLKALVEEMNRYNETPQQALRMLNAKPEYGEKAQYTVALVTNGVTYDSKRLSPSTWSGNPLANVVAINYWVNYPIGSTNSDENDEWEDIKFQPGDIIKVDPSTGSFVFSNSDGNLILTKVKHTKMDYFGAF